MKTITISALSILAALAVQAAATVENVYLEWNGDSGEAKICYDLKGEAAIITLDIIKDGVSIGPEKLTYVTGDVNRLVQIGDEHVISWKPDGDATTSAAFVKARVYAWSPSDPPDYLVANLGFAGADVRYYTDASQVPGGVEADTYKFDRLLMRRIHAKDVDWQMGSTTGQRDAQREARMNVRLTNDYYIAVYPFTQGQYWIIWGSRPSGNTCGGGFDDWKWTSYPMSFASYGKLRGVPSTGTNNWPEDGHKVAATSWINILRGRTGLPGLDLPTEAQWEFAARAGDYDHDLYNGYNLANNDSDPHLDEIAWPPKGTTTSDTTTYEVGLKKPNAYGLYDMLGNVWEICLDRFQWKSDYPETGYDPNIGSVSQYAGQRNMRGGSSITTYGPRTCRVCYRECTGEADEAGANNKGFRPCLTLYP